MSQSSSDKFLFFTVGLLKGSEALEALRQDAVKHHMIDNPGQLIALRLTEYYELMSQKQQEQVAPTSASPSVSTTNATNTTPTPHSTTIVTPREADMRPRSEQRQQERNSATEWRTPTPVPSTHSATSFEVSPSMPAHVQATSYSPTSQVTGRMRALMRDGENVVTTSTNADQNADDAADYWSTL